MTVGLHLFPLTHFVLFFNTLLAPGSLFCVSCFFFISPHHYLSFLLFCLVSLVPSCFFWTFIYSAVKLWRLSFILSSLLLYTFIPLLTSLFSWFIQTFIPPLIPFFLCFSYSFFPPFKSSFLLLSFKVFILPCLLPKHSFLFFSVFKSSFLLFSLPSYFFLFLSPHSFFPAFKPSVFLSCF